MKRKIWSSQYLTRKEGQAPEDSRLSHCSRPSARTCRDAIKGWHQIGPWFDFPTSVQSSLWRLSGLAAQTTNSRHSPIYLTPQQRTNLDALMLTPLLAIALHATTSLVAAQLSFSSPPWLPPDISDGASKSNEVYPNTKWSSLLGNTLYFYEAQRSGELPQDNRVSWRNGSALDDGRIVRHDLSGELWYRYCSLCIRLTFWRTRWLLRCRWCVAVYMWPESVTSFERLDFSKQTLPLVRPYTFATLCCVSNHFIGFLSDVSMLGSNRLWER